MIGLLKFVGAIAAGVASSLTGGYVFASFWGWFVVPRFSGAPTLGYLDGVGVMLTLDFLLLGIHTALSRLQKDTDAANVGAQAAFKALVIHPMFLLIGWFWHLVVTP